MLLKKTGSEVISGALAGFTRLSDELIDGINRSTEENTRHSEKIAEALLGETK